MQLTDQNDNSGDQVPVGADDTGQGALEGVPPFLIALFGNLVNLGLLITLSVYFVIDGPRMIRWLRLKTPLSQRDNTNFLLRALDESVGGYFRGRCCWR